MGLDCGLTTCKYILGFFNTLIFLCGGTVLGVGIWLAVDKKSMLTILKVSDAAADNETIKHFNTAAVLEQAAYILIAVGAIVFLLGFLGCCGAWQESKCMLATYAVFLCIFLLVEIGVGIYAFVEKDKFKSEIQKATIASLKGYKSPENEDAVTLAWNYVFSEFECCGVNDYRDLEGSEWHRNKGLGVTIPKACCKMTDKAKFETVVRAGICQSLADPATSNAHNGCLDAIQNWVNRHLKIIIGVGIGLGLVQLFAVIFACCLCCALDKN